MWARGMMVRVPRDNALPAPERIYGDKTRLGIFRFPQTQRKGSVRGKEDQCLTATADQGLERTEVRDAVLALDHHLAINDG